MARPKQRKIKEVVADIAAAHREYDQKNPVVDTIYVVVEGFWDRDELSATYEWRSIDRLEFNSLADRVEWLEGHDPDEHNEFRLAHYDVRLVTPEPYRMPMPLRYEDKSRSSYEFN